MTLTAIALNCSLKRSGGEPSSTDRLIAEVSAALKAEGVETLETVRVADHDVRPGVSSDEGDGDAWPALRQRILAADILIFGGPIWLGQPSSLAKRVLERFDAFLGETDDKGRTPAYGKVAVAAIVGNEDGAHHVSAELFQALNDVGFTIPAAAATYWTGEAMHKTDYKELGETPAPTAKATAMLARNAAHLARLLRGAGYPGLPEGNG
jgi:multimeric flavodoxin WrbA